MNIYQGGTLRKRDITKYFYIFIQYRFHVSCAAIPYCFWQNPVFRASSRRCKRGKIWQTLQRTELPLELREAYSAIGIKE